MKNINTKVNAHSVGIVGCGWLGKALTQSLIQQGVSVIASTQHKDNFPQLLQLGAQVECLSLSDTKPHERDFKLALFQQSCLVVAIPPGIRKGKKDYPEKIKNLVQLAEAGQVEQLIMISSTAVYDGLKGNVDESAELDLSAEKTQLIHQAEQEAQTFSGDTIILRLSGLVGPDRHPGKFLKGGRLLSDPNATTNLIHQTDAVGLLLGLINKPTHSAIYNGSSNTHVSKKQYYEKAANAIELPVPEFKEDGSSTFEVVNGNKKINGNKIREFLGYTFEYDDLLSWLDSRPS